MGNTASCCDAKTQLDNASNFGKIDSGYSNDKLNNFTVPPPSPATLQLIRKAKGSQYFKAKQNQQNVMKQTLILGKRENGAMYQGETANGTAHGYGVVIFMNGTVFEGKFVNGEPTNGVFTFNSKCYYVGDIQRFQASGEGLYENIENGYKYTGQWKKNLQHGRGAEKYSNNQNYNGNFMVGSKFGEGEYTFADGRVYRGTFYNGHSDGHGILTFPNGDLYDGEWKLGRMHGRGVYKWSNSQKYEGNYVNGVREGTGKYYFSGGATYEGGWFNGLQHGQGVIKEGFDEVIGVWENGQKIK